MPGIDAIITDHLEIRFRDVLDKSLHERQCGNGFVNKFVVFMSVVVESDGSTIVAVNAGRGNNRAAEVSADVFCDNGRLTEIRFGIDVETIFLITVNRGFDFFKRVTEPGMQFIEECSLKGLPQKLIVKVFKRTPPPGIANAAFGNETVDVRIPFEVTAKGMQNTDKAGSKTLRFVGIMEHSKDNAADRREKAVKESPISKEKGTQLLSDGKDAVPVWNINEFE